MSKEYLISPVGIAKFSYLNGDGDTQFNSEGIFHVSLGFSKDMAQPIITAINEVIKKLPKNLIVVSTTGMISRELFELRKTIEKQVEDEMKEEAPNTSAVLGTVVGARILAHAGSLKKLASMPASTIQILGAEKALFRSLKTGSNPPKHGILFQHAIIHSAPKWQRGKIARAVAGKAAIAARVDVYKGGLNQTLLDKLNIRVQEIEKKYKEHLSAYRIQQCWNKAISIPTNPICQRKIVRDYEECTGKLCC